MISAWALALLLVASAVLGAVLGVGLLVIVLSATGALDGLGWM